MKFNIVCCVERLSFNTTINKRKDNENPTGTK